MRHMPSNVESHKFEGHSLPVERLVMLSDSTFLSQAGYEVLLWTSERKQQEMQEVLKPTRILDIESTASIIRCVEGMTVMPQAHVVLVATKDTVQVFMVKTGEKEKAKVKKANITIKLSK